MNLLFTCFFTVSKSEQVVKNGRKTIKASKNCSIFSHLGAVIHNER